MPACAVQPATDFHLPFKAGLTLGGAAVSACQAGDAGIESWRIAGTAGREGTPLPRSHMHTSTTGLGVTLSKDRQTVTAIAASSQRICHPGMKGCCIYRARHTRTWRCMKSRLCQLGVPADRSHLAAGVAHIAFNRIQG